MKIAIILNGVSRKKKKFLQGIFPRLEAEFSPVIFETQRSGHAEELAAQAVIEKFDVILAAGGDGTLHQVINGVLKNEKQTLPIIGLIPLGSGNDFAKMCFLRADSSHIIQLLKTGKPRPVDVGLITCRNRAGENITRYFINACSAGLGPEVVRQMEKNSRRWGANLTYLKSIISAFFLHRPQEINCRTSGWEWKGSARIVAIANARSFGNSLYIAPRASVDDGEFNSFIAGEVPLLRFLVYLQVIKWRRKISYHRIHYNTLHEIELTSPLPAALEGDGELEGFLPARIKVLPGRINFLR